MNAYILTFWSNKISKKIILSNCMDAMEYSLYLILGRLQILGGQDHMWPPGSASDVCGVWLLAREGSLALQPV